MAIGGFVVVTVRMRRVATRDVKIATVAVLGGVAGHLTTDTFMSPEVTTWLAWILLGGSLGMIACQMRQPQTPAPRDVGSRNV